MTLSSSALVILNQAKSFLKIDSSTSLMILAEYVGTGTGTKNDFTLDHTPLEGTLILYVNNVAQVLTTNYTMVDAAITFITASIPANGLIITASYTYAASSDAFESYDEDIIERLIEAATKRCEDYCGRKFVNVTLTEYHVGDGSKIIRLYRRPVNSVTSVSYKKQDAFTGNAVEDDFTLSYTPLSGSLTVYVDGVLKSASTHYSLTGKVVTFGGSYIPTAGQNIICQYYVQLENFQDYTEQLSVGRLSGGWLKGTEYQIVYSAGSGVDRATVAALLPDAVTAILIAVANWYENRTGVSSESISGIGSTNYDQGLPEASKKLLGALKV